MAGSVLRLLLAQGGELVVGTPEQAAALQTTSVYLNQAGMQVASVLLGFPQLTGDTATLAEFSTLMSRSAALCDGLLELTDELYLL